MRRFGRALGALLVLTSGSAALLSGTAAAGPCGGPVAAGTTCDLTGTVTLTAGTLTLTSPASLTWATTLNGNSQSLVDVTAADEQLTVNDATGSGAGWHITTAATTFTSGSNTLPNIGTFVVNGSLSSVTSTTGPSATCVTTCTLPTNSIGYPVAITTAPATPTPVTIFDAAATTGLGEILIGGSTQANPLGWWVNVPGSAAAGVYTSTITMEIISGP